MKLGSIFRDGMVLQANKPTYVFGEGEGEAIVEFCGKTYSTVSNDEKWVIEMQPADYAKGLDMIVVLNGEKTVLRNIAVGEVILVSGQSNVQLRVGEENFSEEYPDDEDLRFFAVNRLEKDPEVFTEEDGWQSVKTEVVKRFSAVGFHTGRELREKLGVVVGVVACYQGASVIQSWLDKSSGDEIDSRIDPKPRKETSIQCGYFWNENGRLYEQMFSRIVPYSFSNVVWYQGESNAYKPDVKVYADALKKLVALWREDLEDANLRFTVVVICDMDGQSEAFTGIQRVQRALRGVIDGVEIVESSDVCEHTSIHPGDKRALSKRIADVIVG